MTEGLNWGLPVILYLFLAGVGAGAMTVSASVLLRGGGGGFGGEHFALARYGAMIAPFPVMVGCGLLILELGSFQTGHWFKWINLYMTINWSPMSIGTWLLTLFIGVSVLYAYTFVAKDARPGDRLDKLRQTMAWIGVPLGIAVAVYTGILLGAMPSRPFWNSPVLALLFLVSALSTGVACIILARALLHAKSDDPEAERGFQQGGYLLTASDTLLIGTELMVVFLFIMYAYLTVGSVQEAVQVILPGGTLAALFWIWFVLVGLVLPALVELRYVLPRLLYHRAYRVHRAMEIVVPALILVGGFMLRYVVVIAGQITGPVGI
ncbi:MAG: NrfD/PsrC family molybdoenzyme membrane anchor subunit [Alphaproteobacteria bacterium]